MHAWLIRSETILIILRIIFAFYTKLDCKFTLKPLESKVLIDELVKLEKMMGIKTGYKISWIPVTMKLINSEISGVLCPICLVDNVLRILSET